MNHILKMKLDKQETTEKIWNCEEKLVELLIYLSSSKFSSVGDDYIHVSTDLKPKLYELLYMLRDVYTEPRPQQ